MQQQPPGIPATGNQHSCPRCGASIDTEMGRCTGCGLLYGGKHRIVQEAASDMPPACPPLASSPQSSTGQQPPAAYGTGPQYNNPEYSPPSSGSGQRPSYISHGGVQSPIPRIAPAAASTVPMQARSPLPARPYPYETVPPVPGGGGVSGAGKRGLKRIITTLFIIIVCFFVGSGIYYFVNQGGASSPSNGTADITLLSIQGVSTSSITETGATINWGTDEPTTGKVEYWKTETDVLTTPVDSNLSTSHSVKLTGLDPGTTYYFKVISTDTVGNEATVEGNLKTLAAADETAPTISAVSSSSITESSAIITWITDERATSQVKYGETEEYGSETTESTKLSTSHSVKLTELDPDTTYHYTVISKDASENEATFAEDKTFKTLPPVGYLEGNLAPEFMLEEINEKVWKLSDFRGKIVMVNFWATWCEPCTHEMPFFQEIEASEDWSEDLKILAINYKEPEEDVRSFLQVNAGYKFTVLLDLDGKVAEKYGYIPGTTKLPLTFFIDAEGIIKKVIEGVRFNSTDEIEDILDTLQTP